MSTPSKATHSSSTPSKRKRVKSPAQNIMCGQPSPSVLSSQGSSQGWIIQRYAGINLLGIGNNINNETRQQQFALMHLHAPEKKHGTHAHHVLEVEEEGKGPVDGLGVAIKRLIRNICSCYPHTPTLFELYTELTRITKSAPIRGPKYRKYKQYRFVLVQLDEISTLTPGDTIPATTNFYQYASTGKPGELSRRRMPCFCDCCMRGAYHRCPNAAFCGPHVCFIRTRKTHACRWGPPFYPCRWVMLRAGCACT